MSNRTSYSPTPYASRAASPEPSHLSRRVSVITEESPLLHHGDGSVGSGKSPGRREYDELQGAPAWSWLWWRSRVRYYVPATRWMMEYKLSYLWGDTVAAITVATVIIPLSLSYASSLAHLDPFSGLFAAAVQPLVYSLLGSCAHLSVGPEGSLSLLVGQAIQRILHDDPHSGDDAAAVGSEVATMITFQVGMISLCLGLLRLGFIDVVLSRSLLRGFVTAVSLVIVIEQLVPMLGLSHVHAGTDLHTAFDKCIFLVQHLRESQMPTAILSLCSISFLIVTRTIKTRFKKRFGFLTYLPEILICVIVTTILCSAFEWQALGIEVLGAVSFSSRKSFFALPLQRTNLRFFKQAFPTAIFCSIVGFIDSVVAAKQNAQRFRYSVSPNRELTALGAGNIAASFVPSTLPAYGAITRSRLAADTGGKTPMSSLILSIIVLLSIRFLLPALYFLPKAVLACIICLVVYTIIAEMPEDILFYWKMSAWNDMFLMMLTFILTLVWSVEVGIGIPFALTILLVVKQSSQQRIKIMAREPGTTHYVPIDEDFPTELEDTSGVLVVRIFENLNFVNTGSMKERLRRLELYGSNRHHPSDAPIRDEPVAVVFQLADVEEMDASAVQIFRELAETYTSRGVCVCFARVRPAELQALRKGGVVDFLGENHFHPTVAAAVSFIEHERHSEHCSPRNGSIA
ncbi:sulfate permease [Calocera viscosa TUFC12733]|uniref:Sulfate permease n=1 Tax=Calocera viscosa (strain TUFC12733) TaxID=1330018 RepID=A0A167GIZ9_CALVF|nr:sulfate permease [Calocera viscosa TUFC12733]